MQKIFQKTLNFIKYHNLTPIVFTIVFVGLSLSFAASPEMREAIYSKTEREVGIDNTLLLATNLDSWDFQPQIVSIEEDEENYYVAYKFKSLGVENNVWQEIWKEKLLQFPKSVLGNRDFADYVTEEIGEVILHEYQVLKDTQKIAQKEGKSQRVKVTEYSGLIGKILNLKPKVEPIEPVVSEIALQNLPQETLSNLSSPQVDEEMIRQIVEKILAEKNFSTQPLATSNVATTTSSEDCIPNWQCTDWQPGTDEYCSDQTFTQTRTCTDLNNCDTDEGKPAESQTATGTKDCSEPPTSTPSS